MRSQLATFGILLLSATVHASPCQDSVIWVTEVNQNIGAGNYADMNSCWVVQNPTGPSDFFSVCFKVVPGIPNTEDVAEGLPVTGMSVNLCIPGGVVGFFPRIGVYYPVSSSSCTPDLANPVIELLNVVIPGPLNNEFFFLDTAEALIAPGTSALIAAVQLPPGDAGQVRVGGDSSASTSGTSYFSMDAYSTAAIPFPTADMGINIGQDNSTTTSCTVASRLPHGRFRAARGDATSGFGIESMKGDRLLQHIQTGETLRLSFFGAQPGDVYLIFLMTPICTPSLLLSPVLFTLPDGDGDGSYQRLSFTWPNLAGSFDFAAVWGNFSCAPVVAGFTNCVTVISP